MLNPSTLAQKYPKTLELYVQEQGQVIEPRRLYAFFDAHNVHVGIQPEAENWKRFSLGLPAARYRPTINGWTKNGWRETVFTTREAAEDAAFTTSFSYLEKLFTLKTEHDNEPF